MARCIALPHALAASARDRTATQKEVVSPGVRAGARTPSLAPVFGCALAGFAFVTATDAALVQGAHESDRVCLARRLVFTVAAHAGKA